MGTKNTPFHISSAFFIGVLRMTEPRELGRPGRGRRSTSRTMPLPGDGDEEGNWYTCPTCGMHCNDKTDELDDGASRVRVSHEDFTLQSQGIEGLSAYAVLGGILHTIVVALADSNGNPQTVVHKFNIVNTHGCPGDGNLNWRGDY